MKKCISISFLVIYLFSTSELIELSKLPMLLKHYQQHKAWDSKITFWGFILEHYSESIEDNPDYDLDKKLPFKSHADQASFSIWVTPVTTPTSYLFKITTSYIIRKQLCAYRDGRLISSFLSNIWQPPKFC